MRKERLTVATEVADNLFEAEKAIDAALTTTARLAGVIPALRGDAKLSALVGQGAIERAIRSVAALGEARREIVEAHKELTLAQELIGLRTTAFGEWGDKPPPPPPKGEVAPPLEVVAPRRAA